MGWNLGAGWWKDCPGYRLDLGSFMSQLGPQVVEVRWTASWERDKGYWDGHSSIGVSS